MAQILYLLIYLAAFVLGLAGSPLCWALALALLSAPAHLLMRWEGHRLYGLPMEDWRLPSLSLLLVGQVIIQAVLWGVARLLALLLRSLSLV